MVGKSKCLSALMLPVLCFGLLAFLSGCPQNTAGPTIPADGTLPISLTAAGAVEGKGTLFAVLDSGADPYSDPLLAGGDFDIVGGTGNATAAVMVSPYGDWVGTGGHTYDVYLWVDIDGDSATVQYPESGVDMRLKTYPVTVDIDANISLTYSGTDVETVP